MKPETSPDDKCNEWHHLRSQIVSRTVQPIYNATYVLCAVSTVLILGPLGVWIEIAKAIFVENQDACDNIPITIAIFTSALIGSSSFRIILSSTQKMDKILASFGYSLSLVSFIVIGLIYFIHYNSPKISLFISALMAIFSIWLWWFANSDDPTYESAPNDAATGGDTDRNLKGDIRGFSDD